MNKIISILFFIIGSIAFAAPTVTDVVAKQRYPWNGLVDITCKVSGLNDLEYKFKVDAIFPDSSETLKVQTVWLVRNGVKSDNLVVNADETYHLLWDAKADLGEVRYTNMVVRVSFVDKKKVQLWEGGPYWATTNIGANEPWESGCYFWWGDTIGYKRENGKWVASDGSNSNFLFAESNTLTYNKGNSTLKNEGWITAEGVLAPEHDAAHKHWGGNWRMPTRQEFDDLNSKCDWVWVYDVEGDDVGGFVIRGKGDYASNSIFLPSVDWIGNYWSSAPCSDGYTACYLTFHNLGGQHFIDDIDDRYYGKFIRPVQSSIK